MSHLQDLHDYKLETEFHTQPEIVLHRSYRADWSHGRQRVVLEEKWAPQKPELGVGTFGNVRLERRQNLDGQTQYQDRAVKQLRKMDMARMKVDFRKELAALTKFSRPKFVQSQAFVEFLGWFENDEHIFIAMEYFQHGTLDRFITEELSELDARVIALQLLEGLRIMHEEQFAHRDLKPQNIFVVQHSPTWWVKIGDFGISKRVANNDTVLRTHTGTPLYLAPEIPHYVPSLDEESDAYTSAVDIWSFACVVYEMLALQVPFVNWPRSLVAFCNGGQFPDAPLRGRTTSVGIEFIKSILIPLPAQRPTAQAALDSSWFQVEIPNEFRTSNKPTTTEDYDTESIETLKHVFSVSRRRPEHLLHPNQETTRVPDLSASALVYNASAHNGLRSYRLPSPSYTGSSHPESSLQTRSLSDINSSSASNHLTAIRKRLSRNGLQTSVGTEYPEISFIPVPPSLTYLSHEVNGSPPRPLSARHKSRSKSPVSRPRDEFESGLSQPSAVGLEPRQESSLNASRSMQIRRPIYPSDSKIEDNDSRSSGPRHGFPTIINHPKSMSSENSLHSGDINVMKTEASNDQKHNSSRGIGRYLKPKKSEVFSSFSFQRAYTAVRAPSPPPSIVKIKIIGDFSRHIKNSIAARGVIEIQTHANEKISKIKKKIREKTNIPTSLQRLDFQGHGLESSQRITDRMIWSGDPIYLDIPLPSPVHETKDIRYGRGITPWGTYY